MSGIPWSVRNSMAVYRQGDWVEAALCAQMGDKDAWFPNKGEPCREAKSICGMCEVREPCLQYALQSPTQLFGIWGGTTEHERKLIRRRLGIRTVRDIDHGTEAGVRAHYRAGERPCIYCRLASRTER